MVEEVKIVRKGFSELSDEALKELDEAVRDVVEGRGKPVEELLKRLKPSK